MKATDPITVGIEQARAQIAREKERLICVHRWGYQFDEMFGVVRECRECGMVEHARMVWDQIT